MNMESLRDATGKPIPSNTLLTLIEGSGFYLQNKDFMNAWATCVILRCLTHISDSAEMCIGELLEVHPEASEEEIQRLAAQVYQNLLQQAIDFYQTDYELGMSS